MRIGTGIAMAVALTATTTACEHKSPRNDQGAGSGKNPWTENGQTANGSGAPAMGSGSNGAAMAKPAPPPPPAPTPADNANPDVKAPTADDFAAYTKDIKGSGPLTATIDTTVGTFHCELFGDKTPITVANFVGLATGQKPWLNPKTNNVEKGKPFYDGLIFHRVIPKFMIQGGDPMGTGTSGPGYQFDDEIVPELTMKEGTLAMANAGKRGGHGTNGSQFFITEIAPDWLNGKHTIFGQCKEVDLVKKITAVDRGPGDRPKEDVVIKSVKITKG